MLGCKGEERGKKREKKGGSTYSKATAMSITMAPAADLEEGSDPSCSDSCLVRDSVAPSHNKQLLPHPRAPGHRRVPCPRGAPCSYLPAARPAPQAAADPRSPGVHHGGPQPHGPRQRPARRAQRSGRGIAHAGTQALGQAGGRHAAAKGIGEPGVG